MDIITNLLTTEWGKQVVSGISDKAQLSSGDATSVISKAFPVILGALQNNASTQEGANGIMNALTSKHDGSILDNITSFFQGDSSDGKGILQHVLGNNQKEVTNQISQKTGVNSGKVSQVLIMLAPIVMGYIGKQMKGGNNDSNSSGNGGLVNVLGSLLGGTSGNIVTNMLDQNGDGKLGMDDLGGFMGKIFGNKK